MWCFTESCCRLVTLLSACCPLRHSVFVEAWKCRVSKRSGDLFILRLFQALGHRRETREVRNDFKMAMTLDSWFQVKTNASLSELISKLWSNSFMCPGMFLQPMRNGLSRLPKKKNLDQHQVHSLLPWFRGRKDPSAVCNPVCLPTQFWNYSMDPQTLLY